MTGADPIVAPTGQLLPGGLRALGIGAIPSNAPVAPPPTQPEAMPPPLPDQAAAAAAPPTVPQETPEAPRGADLPSIGLPSALTNFFETGKLPPRPEPLQIGRKYVTELPPDQEQAFQAWAAKNKVPWQDTPNADYDMRGFWSALQVGDPRAATAINPADKRLHFPDTWKTPYHATFSNESQYAAGRPDAPHWQGNVLVAPDGRVVADERTPAEKRADAKAAKAAQAPATSPAGAPPTLGQAYDQTQNAAAAQIGAVANEADVAAKQADATLKAREDADKVLQAAQEQLRARIERDQEVLGQKQAAVEAANKELDNYKIDPHRFWKGEGTAKKVGWFISMALSGIGDALQGKSGPNPVIGMLQNTIENDVKLQMDQRDALRAKAQRAGQALDSADRFSQNRFAQEQYMLAQAYTMAGRQIEIPMPAGI